MTPKPKKPKPSRCYFPRDGVWGTFYPDGATPPLPPEMRRVVRAAERWAAHPLPTGRRNEALFHDVCAAIDAVAALRKRGWKS